MSPSRLVFALRNSPGYVDGSKFTNDDLRALPPDTVALRLEGAPIDDQGILVLPSLPRLRCLDLDNTRVTDKGLSAIASLPQLEELWLECTDVTDAGLQQLHAQRQLRFVSVAYTKVSASAVALLKVANPGVQVSA